MPNCETSTTPLWRRDESGSVLCNACGLFLKLHGRPRPISLKTDVIKSRNRVKSANQGPKKQINQQSLPASQSTDVQNGAHRRVSQMTAQFNLERSHSPISRTGTPSMHHDPNIAPQHMFDGVALQDHQFQTPALPQLGGHQSPGSLVSLNDRQLEQPMSYEALVAQNAVLKTRVSELEVINMVFSDNENNLRRERDEAIQVTDHFKRRIEELEQQLQSNELAHPNKKQRVESPSEAQQGEEQAVSALNDAPAPTAAPAQEVEQQEL
ncbi:GATA zinc finger protein 3 [Knufia obscura]|uniref:GATA zinc finger protein 3 n=1 Tax=Knufia obscura TaxID=1635080 RepID=A0ABR0RV86_9EURO|nr:GATA zinc finger protein 3 [Knufia obscura]